MKNKKILATYRCSCGKDFSKVKWVKRRNRKTPLLTKTINRDRKG